MNGVAYLGVAVAMAAVLSTLLWLVRRRPRSLWAGIDEFRRGMDALARRPRPEGRRRGPRGARPEPLVPAIPPGDLARKLRAARQRADGFAGRRRDGED